MAKCDPIRTIIQAFSLYRVQIKIIKFQIASISEVNRTKLPENFELNMKKKCYNYTQYKSLLEVLFLIENRLKPTNENGERLKCILNWTHP
jgi:hypothetical protein